MGDEIPVWAMRDVYFNIRSNTNTSYDLPRTLLSFKMEFITKKSTGDTHLNRSGEKRVMRRGEESGRPTKISSISLKQLRTEKGPYNRVGCTKKGDAKQITMRENKTTLSKERQKMSTLPLLPK